MPSDELPRGRGIHRRAGGLTVLRQLLRHRRLERRLRSRDGSFRSTDAATVSRTYGAMSAAEFEELNALQQWFNEKAIPLAVRHALTITGKQPQSMIDLGCGSGGSTELLARCAPPGSRLLGYEMCPSLLASARTREYRDARGEPLPCAFVRQSITDTLRDPAGAPLPNGSCDLAHSAGVIGHHLGSDDLERLVRELHRVLRRGGVAILDGGPCLPRHRLRAVMRRHGFALRWSGGIWRLSRRAPMVFRLDAPPGEPAASRAESLTRAESCRAVRNPC
ncbi:MAG: class I SAM-dependent methyltransferase [Planctomycetes bacterium]|nr:class I SAM-dependent methyltransferase [Planctomycetota bacterium]MCB9872459.1 class I SAM-dependent methyltransferase [Planctomycetota bacterium]